MLMEGGGTLRPFRMSKKVGHVFDHRSGVVLVISGRRTVSFQLATCFQLGSIDLHSPCRSAICLLAVTKTVRTFFRLTQRGRGTDRRRGFFRGPGRARGGVYIS